MEEEIYSVKKSYSIKIEDDSLFKKYSLYQTKDVPADDMRYLLKLFFNKAAVNMGKESYDAPDAAIESVNEFISKEFGTIPVIYVCSAIIRGSLGKYGSGRLVPNTIYRWMTEVSIEYRRDKEHKDLEEITKKKPIAYDLQNYPLGSAIAKKIDWYRKGLLKIEDWDKIPLKELAEREAKKLESYPELFGLKTDKNE